MIGGGVLGDGLEQSHWRECKWNLQDGVGQQIGKFDFHPRYSFWF